MKIIAIIISVQLLYYPSFSQAGNYIDSQFRQIAFPPNCVQIFNASSSTDSKKFDVSYERILQLKSKALPYLIAKLSDTTDTKIFSEVLNKSLKQGDLALLLINEIYFFPFAFVTNAQWCICCTCSDFPIGFFDYFDAHRQETYERCKLYFQSKRKLRKQNKARL